MLVASAHANMRCPGERREGSLAWLPPRKPSQGFWWGRGHWTKSQQAPSGGQLPETQPASGLIVSYHLVLGFGTRPGPPVAFQYVTLTVATEGRSNPCPVLCSAAVRVHVLPASQFPGQQERGYSMMPPLYRVEVGVLRPWVLLPVNLIPAFGVGD